MMLDIEEEYAERAGDECYRKLHEKETVDTDGEPHDGQHRQEPEVRSMDARPLAPPGAGRVGRVTVLDDELICGSDDQQYKWMAVHAINKALELGEAEILPHRQGVDVPEASLIQIPRRRVMDRVRPAPVVVWYQRENPDERPQDVVCPPRLEERLMPAVVLENEHPNHKECRRN